LKAAPNPYRFFDELRKTPVVYVGDGIYAITGYRELMTLAHDPRVSSDPRQLARVAAKSGSESDPALEAYGEAGTMITTDPLQYTIRRAASRCGISALPTHRISFRAWSGISSSFATRNRG